MKILFLHGFPDNPEVWRYCVSHLEKRAVCRTPELHSLSFTQQIQRVHEMSEEGAPVVLVGHDMGGPLASEYAELYPERVSRVVLINSMGLSMFAHRLRLMEQLLKSSYMGVFLNPLVNTTTLKPLAKHLLKLVYDLGGLPADDRLRSNGPEVLDGLARYKELAFKVPKKLFEPAAALPMQVDLVFGEKDPFLMLPTENELKRFFHNPKLHTMPGAGHWPMRTHAEELHALLDQILFEDKA